jgi:hypothetical protein
MMLCHGMRRALRLHAQEGLPAAPRRLALAHGFNGGMRLKIVCVAGLA